MHVGILIGHFPPSVFGGAELQAEAWAKRLAARHRVTVITRDEPRGQPAREPRDGYDVVRLPVSRLSGWRTIADLVANARAARALSPRPDVLICFQTFVSGLAGVLAGRLLGVPAVVWIRGDVEYALGASRFYRALSPAVWRAARGVLVQSERSRVDLLRELERHAPGSAAAVRARLDVVENGLELPQGPFEPGSRVVTVGRLVADKGMDSVIDAAARAGLPLTIVGDGPERAALEARAGVRGVDVRFEGSLPREELDPIYRSARCVVLASRRGEGLPNVLLEGMAYARPVVTTPCAGATDLVVDAGNGLIVPQDDPDALAAALLRLDADPALAARLGTEGRRTAERFEWSRVVPRLETALARWGVA